MQERNDFFVESPVVGLVVPMPTFPIPADDGSKDTCSALERHEDHSLPANARASTA